MYFYFTKSRDHWNLNEIYYINFGLLQILKTSLTRTIQDNERSSWLLNFIYFGTKMPKIYPWIAYMHNLENVSLKENLVFWLSLCNDDFQTVFDKTLTLNYVFQFCQIVQLINVGVLNLKCYSNRSIPMFFKF